jgi:transposase
MDEAGIWEKDCQRLYGYAPKGERCLGLVSGKKGDKQSVIAGLRNHEVIAPFVYTGIMDGKLFLEWVEKELCPVLKEGQVVILDNARIHHVTLEDGRNIHMLLKNIGCRALFLPPYSPELNKIEPLWAWIKNEIKRMIDQFDSLQNKIKDCINSINLKWKKYYT